MSDVPTVMTVEDPHSRHTSGLDRLTILAAWALAGALFLTVGWMALAPYDPLGPVSLLVHRAPILALVEAAALAAVASALGTVIAGKHLADAGTFGTAVGLAAVALRGATAEYLLVYHADKIASSERGLAWAFALEAIGWICVMGISVLVSGIVSRWCFGDTLPGDTPGTVGERYQGPLPAGLDVPGLSARILGVRRSVQTPPRAGLRHTSLSAGIGLLAITLLYTGHRTRSIDQGQVCFVLAAASSAGTYFAYRAMPVRSALWPIMAAAIIAVVAYLWTGLWPDTLAGASLPPNIPSSRFMRALPIQYVSVGMAGAIGTFWYMFDPSMAVRQLPTAASASTSGDEVRV